jgi:hypothetical protein
MNELHFIELRTLVRLLAVVTGVLVLGVLADPAFATDYKNDFRIRAGVYDPTDLPTGSGAILGIEFRNRLTETGGIYYGVSYFNEEKSQVERIGTNEFLFRTEVEMLPITIGWYRFWDFRRVTISTGAGLGLYEVNAFSGGFSGAAGVQVSASGEFRSLSDDSRTGVNLFGTLEFFPDYYSGFMVEVRGHLVEDDFGGIEIATGVLLRF